MIYLVNRILYSCYCIELYIDKKLNMLIFPLIMNTWGKFMYHWDPFGYIKKNNMSMDEFAREKLKLGIHMYRDIDDGYCSQRAQGETVVIFMMYSFLIVSFLRYKRILYLDESFFFPILMGLGLTSFIVVYLVAFRKDRYKEYFEKFRRERNRKFKDTCWNIITFILYVGILYCIAQSVILWDK